MCHSVLVHGFHVVEMVRTSDRDRLIDARLKRHRSVQAAHDKEQSQLFLHELAAAMARMEVQNAVCNGGAELEAAIQTDRDGFIDARLKKHRAVQAEHDQHKSEVFLDRLVALMARIEVRTVMLRKSVMELEAVLRVYDRAAVDVAWRAAVSAIDEKVDLSDLKYANSLVGYSHIDSVLRRCYLSFAQRSQ